MPSRPDVMEVPAEEWAGYLEWRGRAPDQSAGGKGILLLKQLEHPEWRFEWHPQARRVYLVRIGVLVDIEGGGKAERGEPIAYNIENYGAAWNAVLIYMRGVKEGVMRRLGVAPKSTTLVGV